MIVDDNETILEKMEFVMFILLISIHNYEFANLSENITHVEGGRVIEEIDFPKNVFWLYVLISLNGNINRKASLFNQL